MQCLLISSFNFKEQNHAIIIYIDCMLNNPFIFSSFKNNDIFITDEQTFGKL